MGNFYMFKISAELKYKKNFRGETKGTFFFSTELLINIIYKNNQPPN